MALVLSSLPFKGGGHISGRGDVSPPGHSLESLEIAAIRAGSTDFKVGSRTGGHYGHRP